MTSRNIRLPKLHNGPKLCIICEGAEEAKYIEKLIDLEVFDEKYKIDIVNANGNGNIFARYQDKVQNGSYNLVLIFCDTEKKPYEQYGEIKAKVNTYHDIDGIANEIIMFANPCTMQIVIKHWADITLKTNAKKVNAQIIEELTGVENYKGRNDQIDKIMELINVDNYNEMKERISKLNIDDNILGSTNFMWLITRLEDNNTGWVKKLEKKL